jgi:8-oxo-dGTP pyrophosphatase MutT (NUDIX family)
MMDRAAISAMVRAAAFEGDGEALKSRELILDLLAGTPEPFSRRQFTPGHITATGLVLAPDGGRVVLVHHRRLDRWLPPGGHVEPEDAEIWDAGRREVTEETGAALEPACPPGGAPQLVSLDVHGIPARGPEPYHLHHDLVFLFRATAERVTVSEESHAVAWCAPVEFDRYRVPGNVRRAWARARVRELFS